MEFSAIHFSNAVEEGFLTPKVIYGLERYPGCSCESDARSHVCFFISGGAAGGRLIAEGTPEQIAQPPGSYTGQCLRGIVGS